MTAGALRYTVLIEAPTAGAADGYGAPAITWAPRCTLRAAILTGQRDDTPGGAAGKRDRNAMTFRTRAFDGVTTRDRLTFKGAVFTVTAVKWEDRWMELTCEALT